MAKQESMVYLLVEAADVLFHLGEVQYWLPTAQCRVRPILVGNISATLEYSTPQVAVMEG